MCRDRFCLRTFLGLALVMMIQAPASTQQPRGHQTEETAKDETTRDALKNYASKVLEAYERVMTFKGTGLTDPRKLSSKEILELNSLIESYNKTRSDYGSLGKDAVSPILAKYPALTPVAVTDQSKNRTESMTGSFTVWVFKFEGGKWAKQEDRTLSTDDQIKARNYEKQVKSFPGWTATSNVTSTTDLAGTSWIAVYENEFTKSDVIFHFHDDHTLDQSSEARGKGIIAGAPVQRHNSKGRWRMEGNSLHIEVHNRPDATEYTVYELVKKGSELRGEEWAVTSSGPEDYKTAISIVRK